MEGLVSFFPNPKEHLLDMDYRQKPASPAPYPIQIDERMMRVLKFAVKASPVSPDPQMLAEMLGLQLRNVPGSKVLAVIKRYGLMSPISDVLVPYTEAALKGYSQREFGVDIGSFWRALSPRDHLIMSLLFLKDAETAEHCCDTLIVSLAIIYAFESSGIVISSQDRLHLLLAAFRHDIGKLDVPDLILCNPFQRHQLPRIYLANIIDPKRKRDIELPKEIQKQEVVEFEALFRCRNWVIPTSEEISKANRLVKLLIKHGCDFRELIPIRYLLKVARDVTSSGNFPGYAPPLEGQGDEVLDEESMKKITNHQDTLTGLELILDLARIDGWQMSFKDALEIHETAGLALLGSNVGMRSRQHVKDSPIVLSVIGSHHGYDSTKCHKIYNKIRDSHGANTLLIQVLQLVDIICALAQHRPYKPGKSASVVSKILAEETQRLGINPGLLDIVKPLVETGDAEVGDVLNAVRRNVESTFGPIPMPKMAAYV